MTNIPDNQPVTPDQRSYAALRIPASRQYLLCAALAMMADSVEHVISYWIIFEKFQSPALAGFAVIAHWVPFLLGSIWAGALADRYDPRRIIQVGMVLFMLVSLGWGILFATDSLARWHAVILLIVHGLAGALWAPASQVLIHNVVGGHQLQSAIRLMATSLTLGLLLGPAVGGALLIFVGPTYGILINVLIYLPLTIWLINHPERIDLVKRKAGATISSFRDMFVALRQVAGIPVVFAMSMLAGLAATLVGNAHQPQMPEFAADLGYAGQGIYYSLLLGANAAGALTAGIVLEARSMLPARTRTAFILGIFWAAAIFGFAVSPFYGLSFGLLALAGFFDLSFNSMTRTLAQLNAPAEIRGRAIGVFNVGSLGCRTFSGFTVGFGGGLIGIHVSLAVSAGILLVAMGVLFVWARKRGIIGTN
ncbi:MAG: MFS transporter [Alphaproteobacteria bacterium]|nr:MFS transporter [Alphaproteobacteria bacterium]